MSNIVSENITVKFTDRDMLISAMSGFGAIYQEMHLYRMGDGLNPGSYDLILVDERDSKLRINFKQQNGEFLPCKQSFLTHGLWTKRISQSIHDRYVALLAQKNACEKN